MTTFERLDGPHSGPYNQKSRRAPARVARAIRDAGLSGPQLPQAQPRRRRVETVTRVANPANAATVLGSGTAVMVIVAMPLP